MATSRIAGVQAFESRFPVLAANLRALVSSWLPAARDPSPIDDDANRETAAVAGRPERYQPPKPPFKALTHCALDWHWERRKRHNKRPPSTNPA
jgi:hypothetical protein